MYFIATAFGSGFHQTRYMNSGLNRMISGDKAHITTADDEKILARAHQVPVHKRLKRACAINTGQRVARKCQAFFTRASCYEQHFWVNQNVNFTIFKYTDRFILKNPHSRAAFPDFHRGVLTNGGLEFFGDVDTARASEDRFTRAKEAMCLQDELAAEMRLIIDQNRTHTNLSQFNRCGKPSRTSTDDQHIHVIFWRWRCCNSIQRRDIR